jgi:hypothetical protein
MKNTYPPMREMRASILNAISEELHKKTTKELKKLIIQQAGFMLIMHDNLPIAPTRQLQEHIHRFVGEYLLEPSPAEDYSKFLN